MTSQNRFIIIAFSLLGLAVILEAIGAHFLGAHLGDLALGLYRQATFYLFIHAMGILIVSALSRRITSKAVKLSCTFQLIGIIFFCISLYLISLSRAFFEISMGFLGMFPPIGGAFFVAGWLIPIFNLKKSSGSGRKTASE